MGLGGSKLQDELDASKRDLNAARIKLQALEAQNGVLQTEVQQAAAPASDEAQASPLPKGKAKAKATAAAAKAQNESDQDSTTGTEVQLEPSGHGAPARFG